MDRRERIADPLASLRSLLGGFQATLWTALPGILQSFDAAKMTAVVQPAIQAQTRDPKGVWSNATLPQCLDVPVSFPRGGGYGMTFPLAKGDEGIIVFASRCIDAWWQSGGVQPQAEFRMHDLSDGMFIPGIVSSGNAPHDYSTTTARFWSEDGNEYVELDKNGGVVNVKATNTINLIAPSVHIQGALAVDGVVSNAVGGGGTLNFGSTNLETSGVLTVVGIDINTHVHTSGIPGDPTSGPHN